MKKWLDKYAEGGLVSKNSLNRKVTCSNCGWSWKLSDGGMDPMTCHKCGGDIKMREGGELDQYQDKGQVNFRDQLFLKNKPIVDRRNFSNVAYTPAQQAAMQNAILAQKNAERRKLQEEISARQAKEKGTVFTLPTGASKKYKDMNVKERAYVDAQSLRNKGRWNENQVEQPFLNTFNPITMLYDMAAGLGEAPLMSNVTNSYMPYVTGIGAPLAVGALAGLGSKTTGQFVNNLANPLAGIIPSTKTIKIKKPIIYESQIDIPTFTKSISEAERLKNIDLETKKIYEDIKEGEGWKYPGVNISKAEYNKAVDNLKNSFIYRGLANAKVIPNKISLPYSHDPVFLQNPGGTAFYQFRHKGPVSENIIYAPDIEDYIYPYHPYVSKSPNSEAIKLAEKDAMKDVGEYYKNYFNQSYELPLEDFLNLPKNKYGGVIKDNRGQWAHPGQVTQIGSPNITMRGVNYPVLGVGADGQKIMMQPGGDYTFNQAPVTEYPMMQRGGGFISNLKKAYVDAYNNYNSRTFPAETLPQRQKAYRTINPSSYLDLRNYGRWVSDEQREESYDPRSEEAFKFYLGLSTPDELKYLKKSKYIPTINAVDKNYYTVDPQLEQDIFNSYKDKVKLEEILQTDESEIETPISGKDGAGLLGRFGVSRGRDKQGDYLSYYDRYDLKDFAQKRTKGMPYSIYNRIYYPKKEQGGEMIKRADGSYSKRGLWDNIRDNRGSGKVPTKQMLDQERKIKSHYQDGGEEEVYWRTKKPMVNDPSMDAISKVLLQRNQDKNFMQRAAGLGYQGGIPTRYIEGQDPNSNNTSNLLMSFGDNQVFPTIIQTGPQQLSYQPNQMEEYIQTPTEDIADYFAAKGYKRAANDMYGMKYQNGGNISMYNNGGEPDGEMAIGQIDAAINKLTNLRKFIQPNSNLEPWVSSKLTMVDDYANSVSDYMMYNPETKGMMELPIEEMEYGGIPMYGPGGQKQNPPKVYTDRKQFEQAQRMYNDSLILYNASKGLINDLKVVNNLPNAEDVWINYLNKWYDKNTKKVSPAFKRLSAANKILPKGKEYNNPKFSGSHAVEYKKPVQPVIYQPASTHPIEHLERLEMVAPTLVNPKIVTRGELLPISPKQTVNLTNLIQPRTYPVDIYDRKGNFIRQEFMGDSEGVVDQNYIGEHHYAPRGGNSFIDTNYAEGGGIPERYRNMGFTKVGAKKQSTRPGKKWMVLAKKGDDYKVVHGGYKGMQDFKQHHSEQRRENFWNRMGGKNSSKATDPFSPLYWHKRFGTWEEGGQTFAIGGQSTLNPIVKKDNRNWLEYLKN